MRVEGSFSVKLVPLETYAQGGEGITLGRLAIDKTFEGALEATSQGEMLSALTTVKGSAGYVAIERVTGSLAGLRGSFVLQHYGVMNRGDSRLELEVVPDSGSGALEGLSGRMSIRNDGGQHTYVFDYTLAY